MPIYSYACDRCNSTVEQIRSIDQRDFLMICKRCRTPMERKIDSPGMVWAPTSTGGGHRV